MPTVGKKKFKYDEEGMAAAEAEAAGRWRKAERLRRRAARKERKAERKEQHAFNLKRRPDYWMRRDETL